ASRWPRSSPKRGAAYRRRASGEHRTCAGQPRRLKNPTTAGQENSTPVPQNLSPPYMFLTLIAFVVALGILITFHELGHYWVARLCGVRVLRFSIGFGQVVLRRTDKRGTEWAVSAIPLGGYVKMQ